MLRISRFARGVTAALALTLCSVAAGAGPASQPASQPAADEAPVQVTVLTVEGPAQVCVPADGAEPKWEALQVGAVLGEHAIIRTGLGATVMLQMADRGQIKVSSVTKMGISELRKEGTKLKTNLGLKYGTVRAHVDSRVGPNDYRVTTPTATLSVRGSEPETGYTAEGGSQGVSHASPLTLTLPGGQSQTIGKGQSVNQQMTPAIQAFLALFNAQMADVLGGSTGAEQQFMLTNSGGRGIIGNGGSPSDFTFGNDSVPPPGFTPPPTDDGTLPHRPHGRDDDGHKVRYRSGRQGAAGR